MKPHYTLSNKHMPMDQLDEELKHVNPVCLDVLCHRGFTTNDQIRGILFPSYQNAIRPLDCKDKESAIRCLANAIKSGLKIVVYRDYDVDGISAGALAVETLAALGAKVRHYANEREVDGYGICKNGIDIILQRWPDTKVILTVDNGIVANEAIAYAVDKGLTVVVTDHHEPGAELPAAAAAVVDLKRKDEVYPYHDLCGCGLIFRIMLDLYRYMKRDPSPVFKTVDLVAFATVADVVPLIGENRALVKEGLQLIESGQRPFFKALATVFDVTEISAHYTLAFQFVPTVNSLSRLGSDTDQAVEAMLSSDYDFVETKVKEFQAINKQRKEDTKRQVELAIEMVGKNSTDSAIVICGSEFSAGIVGIIAGRLKEEFWKPVIVLSDAGDGTMHGSGRSIDEFELKEALDKCSSLLMGYGGHTKAAGLTVSTANFEAFKDKFISLANRALAGKDLRPTVELATVLSEDSLTEQLVRDLSILEPYGEGFLEPVFGLTAQPDSVRYMGSENQHVKFTCSKSQLAIIAWNEAEKIRRRTALPRKFIGKPSLNVWKGNVSVQFIKNPA